MYGGLKFTCKGALSLLWLKDLRRKIQKLLVFFLGPYFEWGILAKRGGLSTEGAERRNYGGALGEWALEEKIFFFFPRF